MSWRAARRAERGQLVAPGPPELREPVQQQDRLAGGGPALGDVQPDAVGGHVKTEEDAFFNEHLRLLCVDDHTVLS